MAARDFSPYQRKIIKRYYQNLSPLALQRLGELVTAIYLADGKKADGLWKRVAQQLANVQLPESRIEHVLAKRDPELLARLVTELSQQA